MANTSPRGTTKSRFSSTTVSPYPTDRCSVSTMGSETEGIEQHREDRVDDHDREEARHHRRRRRPAHPLGATLRREAALAGDESDAQPEEHGIQAPRGHIPESHGLLRLDEVRVGCDVEAEHRHEEPAGDAYHVCEDGE